MPLGQSTYFGANVSKRVGRRGLSVNLGLETQQDRSFGQAGRGVAANFGFYLPMGGGNALGVQYRKSIAGEGNAGLFDTLYLTVARDVRIGRKPSAARIGFLGASGRERRRFGSVRGRVFDDLNDNGRFDVGESGVPDVQLSVPNASAGRTGSDGAYSISALYPQKYVLDLNLDTLPIEYAILSSAEQSVSVPSGGAATIDIPVRRTGNVRGVVFWDDNRNGSFDEGERPISNAVVRVEGSDVIAFSDDEGRFLVSGLAPKTWILNVDTDALGTGTQNAIASKNQSTSISIRPNATQEDVQLGVTLEDRAIEFADNSHSP